MKHFVRIAALTLAVSPAFCGDWNPRLAAQYLDSREQKWFAWPRANTSGVPCLSCHTTLPYALARPALRKALGEEGPSSYESGLLDGVRSSLDKPNMKAHQAVLGSLLFAIDDADRQHMSPDTEHVFGRLWSMQIQEGERKGTWAWPDANLDPWEMMPESPFYGATLAALAVGTAPGDYQSRPAIKENVAMLTAFLCGAKQAQPLHNRLSLVWASTKLRNLLTKEEQKEILNEALRKQGADGGWSLESLGGWKAHPDSPAAREPSNSYATAVTTFLLQRCGISRSDAHLTKALEWLKSHQDAETGVWEAESMNHRYEAESMPLLFMQDAATGYATLALLEAR